MKIGYLMQEGAADIRENPASGPSVHVIRVIKEFQNLGHQVALLVRLDNHIYLSEDLATFRLIGPSLLDRGPFRLFEKLIRRIQYTSQFPYLNFFNSMRFALACHQALPDCDIFYERFGWIGYGGWIAARLLKVPIIWELNGDHVKELEDHGFPLTGAQKWTSLRLMRMIARRIDHTVATGNGWREKHIMRWGVAPAKISVIENGSQVVDMLAQKDLRSFQDLPAEGEKVRIVFLGAFETWHGIKNLLRALSLAIQVYPNLHLDLIGDGPERVEIIDLIHSLKLDDTVSLTGRLRLEDVLPYLGNADIGVSPYCGRAEYSGLKILDYKAAGLAIVASGKDGQPGVLEHSRTGWIVPPCDDNALSEAIICLSKDVTLRRKLGHEARFDAEQFHAWKHTVQKLELLFKETLAR